MGESDSTKPQTKCQPQNTLFPSAAAQTLQLTLTVWQELTFLIMRMFSSIWLSANAEIVFNAKYA